MARSSDSRGATASSPLATPPDLPPRYEPVEVLGKGGGGEVWAVRDRLDGRTVALKSLAEGASEREMGALVREAVALSGLEGLGVPRVLRFGRLPRSGRAYLVREMVEGRSLAELFETSAAPTLCLEAIARASDQLTLLHRASLLHGDVKPANIIVGPDGKATLVDLGLAAPWREGGARPEGLTPRYAAPELFTGAKLDVRAEVFALGATLAEMLEAVGGALPERTRAALGTIARRAMADEPAVRFPSADELASELRRAAKLGAAPARLGADAWPIVGIDATTTRLLQAIAALGRGEALAIEGARGAGKTALVRRAAWSLGVEGAKVAWIEAGACVDPKVAIAMELGAHAKLADVIVLVDDADRLDEAARASLRAARAAGAKLVLVASGECAAAFGTAFATFAVPPLDEEAAGALVARAIPSLSKGLVAHAVARAFGRPGKLRALVRRLDGQTIVTTTDIDRFLDESSPVRGSLPPGPPLDEASRLLDQGRLDEAAQALARAKDDSSFEASIARARLSLGRGDADGALRELESSRARAEREAGSRAARSWSIQAARAHLRRGEYPEAIRLADAAARGAQPAIEAEALTVRGLAESYTGRHEAARGSLDRSIELARAAADRRIESVALASLALALQRGERLEEAKTAYESALGAAEAAGDAGSIATIRLNLAALAQGQGDFGGALAHLEAAVDMGRRAGRGATVQQALLNLANLDLYLGRYARARTSIESLAEQRDVLAPVARAQLVGLEADLAARTSSPADAVRLYEACARAYDELGRGVDAAEACLEGVLVEASGASAGRESAVRLASQIDRAAASLGPADAHRSMLALARGKLAMLRGDEARARESFDEALSTARGSGQKEWIWRSLEARARLAADAGQPIAARRDVDEALAVLEEIASRLPRDLREVFWDDPRRRRLRQSALGIASNVAVTQSASMSTATTHLFDDRLARILEINREIAREHDLPRLVERITDHAVALLRAERGFVILADSGGALVVQASRGRDGDDPHARFSRSIAERVISTGEPVVSLSARDDARLADYVSVHQMLLQSVACVPIRAPGGIAIGALYLETRVRPGVQFTEELPALTAFADQVAIAIENARLVTESSRRAAELAAANEELVAARKRLEELLGHRTAQLDQTRRDLRTTRAVLKGHFGYHGLVGTSASMRKVYALVDRIKDTDIPALVTGESGTGKEMVARAIHEAGPRAKKPFLGVNCGAIPENLLESELFGHVRGAFTGADRDRKGLFREAEGGTLLLDEIGEMPQKMQAGLLRVLQERVVRPVGGARELPVDVRVIAATNRDLSRMVAEGTFREDLFYRLHVVEVHLPALRERQEDVPLLVDHFLGIFAARFRREKRSIAREAIRLLAAHPWPGNVRQLENVLLNAWVTSDRHELSPEDFDLPAAHGVGPSAAPASSTVEPRRAEPTLASHREGERERIVRALNACNWNRVKAAQMVGLPRRTFYRRLKEYGIQ